MPDFQRCEGEFQIFVYVVRVSYLCFMKKILLVFVCSLFAFETVLAQEKNAVGLRLGDGVEFLYQRDLSSRNFLQFTLATPHFEGLSVTGIYNWRCCRWNWTPRTCDWYLNAGVGGALGL